jgi:hypothetical protein
MYNFYKNTLSICSSMLITSSSVQALCMIVKNFLNQRVLGNTAMGLRLFPCPTPPHDYRRRWELRSRLQPGPSVFEGNCKDETLKSHARYILTIILEKN